MKFRRPRPVKRWSELVASLTLVTLVSGCSSDNDAGYQQGWSMISDVWSQDTSDAVRQHVASVPYASIGMTIGDGPQQLLVLASDSGQGLVWTSSAGIWLTTQNGRIVKTTGLRHNMTVEAQNKPDPAMYLIDAPAQTRLYEFRDLGLRDVSVECRDITGAPEDIEILGTELHTLHVVEKCGAPEIGWFFNNQFWIEPQTGFVWRSIQNIHPKEQPIEIEVFRPAKL
jgi:hypothetical protein